MHEPEPELGLVFVTDVAAREARRGPIGEDEAREDLEERRLPRAVRAKQPKISPVLTCRSTPRSAHALGRRERRGQEFLEGAFLRERLLELPAFDRVLPAVYRAIAASAAS
jgi:hypothetical protein